MEIITLKELANQAINTDLEPLFSVAAKVGLIGFFLCLGLLVLFFIWVHRH